MTSFQAHQALTVLREGLALEETGQLPQAFSRFRAATEMDPSCGRAWRHLGNLLRRSGELAAASECFERALAHGDDRSLNEFFLSAVGVGRAVPRAPAHFIAALFDQYAARFESHLTLGLKYNAPQMLHELVMSGKPRRFENAIDLGCGTGLAAKAFKAATVRRTGVDLSSAMLVQARESGLYAQLVQSSIEDYLASATEVFDLILCCDVLTYIGDVSVLFGAVRRALLPGGSFAFSVECCEAEAGFDLLPSLRYAHSEGYIRRMAELARFSVLGSARGAIREEDHSGVEGLAFHLCGV